MRVSRTASLDALEVCQARAVLIFGKAFVVPASTSSCAAMAPMMWHLAHLRLSDASLTWDPCAVL